MALGDSRQLLMHGLVWKYFKISNMIHDSAARVVVESLE
jgi:hypothetical protein